MSRLLHAAARGAKIELLYQRCWIPAVAVRTDGQYKYRIKSADAHLAYGPISTALREMAVDVSLWKSNWEWILASSAAGEFNDCYERYKCEPDYPLFYLFLAEFLADEGM